MTKTWCVDGKHYSNTKNITQFEKVNSKNKKQVKIIKGTVVICTVVINHKFSLSKPDEAKSLLKEVIVKICTVHLCQIQRGLI